MPNIEKMIKKGDIQGLMNLLNNKNINKRIEAVNALCILNNIDGLIKALKNDNPLIRKEAIEELGKIDENDAFQAIIDNLCEERDEDVWLKGYNTLKRILKNKGLDIDKAKFWLKIGSSSLKKNTLEHALKCFDRAIEINYDKETYGSIGAELFDYRHYKESLSYIEKTLEIDPNDVRGWISKGDILFRMDKKDGSINCLKKALEIDPKSEAAFDILLDIYYNSSQADDLAFYTQKALQFHPKNMKFRLMLSEALLLKGQLSEAESEVQKTVDQTYEDEYIESGKLGPAHEQLGIISIMRGHKSKAVENFLKAIDVNRKDNWPYKLFSAYLVVDAMGKIMEGSPLERRARLLKYADLRDPSVARRDFYDYIGY